MKGLSPWPRHILERPVFWLLIASRLCAEPASDTKPDAPPGRQLFSTTTLIETWIPGGSSKTGTGFIIGEELDEKSTYYFLVTCEHVLRGMSSLRATFNQSVAGEPAFGQKVIMEIADLPARTFWHPDPTVDVAVIAIAGEIAQLRQRGTPVFFRSITHGTTPPQGAVKAVQGVVFVGHPKGLIDRKNLTPVVRRGTVATLPDLDFEGAPVFLIDAPVFGGSSGSPVFAYDEGAFTDNHNDYTFGTRLRFLGMISQAYFYEEAGELRFTADPAANSRPADQKSLNIGAVIKERIIFDTLELFYRAQKLVLPRRLQTAGSATP